MRENKNLRVVTIITVVSILLVFSGITYAYFSAFNNQGSTAEITVGPGKMIITYNDGTGNLVPVTDIQPSDAILVNKTFSLTGTNTATGVTSSDGINMPYKVGLKYTSTFSDGQIHYYIKATAKSSNVTVEYTGTTNQTVQGNSTYTGYSHGTLKKGNDKYTEMVTGNFPSSTSNQTITFNLILQFPDTGENQDSEKGATINGQIVINKQAPTTFAEDSWNDIAMFAAEGQIEAYEVGSTKEVEIEGKTYTLRVANNSTPTECNNEDFSQTACGLVIEFVDIIDERVMKSKESSLNVNASNSLSSSTMENKVNNRFEIKALAGNIGTDYDGGTNTGGWPTTELRTYANSEFFYKLPEELQNVIINTKVISGHGSINGETNFTSTDKIYLLSAHEVYDDSTISTQDTAYSQTRQLDYYKMKNVTTSNYSNAIKKFNNSNKAWWLRTAESGSNYEYNLVEELGGFGCIYSAGASINSYGFSPAFRIG